MEQSNPVNVRGIDHVVLRVRDLEAMVAFYTGVLGCRLERWREELGLAQLRAGSGLVDLVDAAGSLGTRGGGPPDPRARNVDHVCLGVHPWDGEAIVAHLRRHGVVVGEIGTRYGAGGSGPSVYIEDPEGNTVELKGEA